PEPSSSSCAAPTTSPATANACAPAACSPNKRSPSASACTPTPSTPGAAPACSAPTRPTTRTTTSTRRRHPATRASRNSKDDGSPTENQSHQPQEVQYETNSLSKQSPTDPIHT